jgi:eukaryotic-like serine/threonine-protein kinase
MAVPPRPKRLGHYDVVAKIGGGGMATIYLGRGPDHVAALKVLRHDASGEQAVAMFMDEAKILSMLSHDNIARTFEYGEEGGHRFIAMELLLGRTLVDVWEACVTRKLSLRLDMSAWIAARIADGLAHAHALTDERGASLNVIHRDVNPSNIFLTYDGKVKLFDFGLAKALGRRAESSAGIIKGKLPYLSPEQIMQLGIDQRADVFMLGTTLWEMTTMRRLFKRSDDVETVKAVRSGAIPDARKLVPGYPPALWTIVSKALQRNRDNRYPDAGAFAHDLDAFLASAQAPEQAMSALIGPILESLFPGERARQTGWLRSTASTSHGLNTIPPPSHLPSTGDKR